MGCFTEKSMLWRKIQGETSLSSGGLTVISLCVNIELGMATNIKCVWWACPKNQVLLLFSLSGHFPKWYVTNVYWFLKITYSPLGYPTYWIFQPGNFSVMFWTFTATSHHLVNSLSLPACYASFLMMKNHFWAVSNNRQKLSLCGTF